MAYGTVNVDAMTTSDGYTSAGTYGFKNKIINGAQVINQRGFSGNTTDGAYTLDRFVAFCSSASKYSVSQNAGSVTPPVGFANYLGVTSLAATTTTGGDYYMICQRIEGYNIADLSWGTANAKTVTLSFLVYSSLTGTFGGSLQNGNQNRAYPFTYTVSSANTWTQISITIAGCTDGTWSSTNTEGIGVYFGLGMGTTYSGTAGAWTTTTKYSVTGATSIVGTNGATFYITGVQLEKGSTATSFDYRPYGTELQLCQRYYYRTVADSSYGQVGTAFLSGSTSGTAIFPFPVPMRVVASSLDWSGVGTCQYASAPTISWTSASLSGQGTKNLGNASFNTGSSAGSTGLSVQIIANNNSAAYVGFSAEL
jgi:hypothetical protein